MGDTLEQFRRVIQDAGLTPPEGLEASGEIFRFPGLGKPPGNRAGWCLLFRDGRGGCFGDWSSGITGHWQAGHGDARSPAARAEFARRIEAQKRRRHEELAARQARAAARAAAVWSAASPAPHDHPYLVRKKVLPYGARLSGHRLTLPVVDFSGGITSLQFINADGQKKLLADGRKLGCFMPVATGLTHPRRIILCEGWATGCTLAKYEPDAWILAAIDAGNLRPVALAARTRWPDLEMVIAGDDDRLTPGNPGASRARAAARHAGALLALPEWPPDAPTQLTDFNDLMLWMEEAKS